MLFLLAVLFCEGLEDILFGVISAHLYLLEGLLFCGLFPRPRITHLLFIRFPTTKPLLNSNPTLQKNPKNHQIQQPHSNPPNSITNNPLIHINIHKIVHQKEQYQYNLISTIQGIHIFDGVNFGQSIEYSLEDEVYYHHYEEDELLGWDYNQEDWEY